jgi:hypothetical protein
MRLHSVNVSILACMSLHEIKNIMLWLQTAFFQGFLNTLSQPSKFKMSKDGKDPSGASHKIHIIPRSFKNIKTYRTRIIQL